MKEVKVRRVGEGLFELIMPFWYWNIHPYIVAGLRQIIAGGELPFHIYRKVGFREIFMVATTRVGALKV